MFNVSFSKHSVSKKGINSNVKIVVIIYSNCFINITELFQ